MQSYTKEKYLVRKTECEDTIVHYIISIKARVLQIKSYVRHLPHNFSDTLPHYGLVVRARISDVTRRRTKGWGAVNSISISLSLSLSLFPSPDRRARIMRHTRIGATWGDRLLWRTYCTPAAGIVPGIQWPGPVSAKHPRLSLLARNRPSDGSPLSHLHLDLQACVSRQVFQP